MGRGGGRARSTDSARPGGWWGGPRRYRLASVRVVGGVLVWSYHVRSGFPKDCVFLAEMAIREGEVPRLVTWEVFQMLRKDVFVRPCGPTPSLPGGGEFAVLYPDLWAFLTQLVWEDGTERVPGSLLVFSDEGVLKCMLRDRMAGMCLWVSALDMDQLLQAVELRVCGDRSEWRVDKYAGGAGKGGKGKK